MSYFVYIMANRYKGTLYIGVTNDIARRASEHRSGVGSAFTKKYEVTQLVHVEIFDAIERAIQREKTLKEWPRQWKVNLIESLNPNWIDLYDTLNA